MGMIRKVSNEPRSRHLPLLYFHFMAASLSVATISKPLNLFLIHMPSMRDASNSNKISLVMVAPFPHCRADQGERAVDAAVSNPKQRTILFASGKQSDDLYRSDQLRSLQTSFHVFQGFSNRTASDYISLTTYCTLQNFAMLCLAFSSYKSVVVWPRSSKRLQQVQLQGARLL